MGGLSNLLNQAPAQPTLGILVFDVLLTAVCAMILAKFYVKFGQSLSNRERLAKNFLLIAITTALIITVVKSSLALSLGLVGALSIVRFRSAIKEPEELAYLFLSISLGLGFGANQHAITLVAFFLILGLVWLQSKWQAKTVRQNLFLSIKMTENKEDLNTLLEELTKHCDKIDLKRVDQSDKALEAGLEVEFKKAEQINQLLKAMKKMSKNIEVSLVDQTGIVV